VVREPTDVWSILEALTGDLEREGVYLHRARVSALRGAKGNREFFFFLRDTAGSVRAAALLAPLMSEGAAG
jgi:predicted rRNA methylase YqxC with S4 and FtsJ domains